MLVRDLFDDWRLWIYILSLDISDFNSLVTLESIIEFGLLLLWGTGRGGLELREDEDNRLSDTVLLILIDLYLLRSYFIFSTICLCFASSTSASFLKLSMC